jgi:hypothetical protein
MPLTIHPDLHSLIPPLSENEYQQLEANLLAHGSRDPLVVWQEEQVLLDGHNRLELCERHGLTYDTHEVSLPDLAAAKAWVIANQLGRRNLTPEQMSYFRGEQYTLLKHQGKRTDLTSPHSEEKSPHTAHSLAAQHHVGHATIERDGAYADAIDTVVDVLGPEVRQTILARETKLTRDGVVQLAELARVDGTAAQAALTDIQAAPTVKEAREALARHVGAGQRTGTRTEEAGAQPARAARVGPTMLIEQYRRALAFYAHELAVALSTPRYATSAVMLTILADLPATFGMEMVLSEVQKCMVQGKQWELPRDTCGAVLHTLTQMGPIEVLERQGTRREYHLTPFGAAVARRIQRKSLPAPRRGRRTATFSGAL